MNGLIGTKVGMTSIYSADGKYTACTVIEASPNVVTQVKSEDSDGYNALQLSFGEGKAKNFNKAITTHFQMQRRLQRKIFRVQRLHIG